MTSTEIIILAGTAISVTGNVVLAYYLQRRSFVMAEYNVLEKTCERQRGEIKDLNQEIGKLKARTDLQPLMDALMQQTAVIQQWRDEGRARFEAATEQLIANTEAVKTLTQLMIQHINGNKSH
jgi:hypothetical protein